MRPKGLKLSKKVFLLVRLTFFKYTPVQSAQITICSSSNAINLQQICPNLFLASGVITGVKSQAAPDPLDPSHKTSDSSLSAPLEATKVSLFVQLWGKTASVYINIMNCLFFSQETAGPPPWLTASPTSHPRKLAWLDQTGLPGRTSCRGFSSRRPEEEEEPTWQRQSGLYMNSCMN